MIRLAIAAIILAGLASIASVLANLQGSVSIEMGGYTIETGMAGLAGSVAALVLVSLALFWLGHFIWHMPARLRDLRSAQRREEGEAALADALMALARGDAPMADKATKMARAKLPDRALPMLMSAQAALLQGEADRAEENYRTMLGAASTSEQKLLGLQGLYYMAQARGDMDAAGTHALRVLEIQPKTVWALDGLMALAIRIGDWEAAATWLRRWSRAGVKRATVKRRRAVIALAEAQSLVAEGSDGGRMAALQKAEQAARLDTTLVAATALAARLQAGHGDMKKARRYLRQAWARGPHRVLADAWLDCSADQPAAGLMRAAAHFIGKQKDHYESHMLRARLAIKSQRWAFAQTLLMPLSEANNPTRSVFELLAEATKGDGDEAAAQDWQAKARNALPEAGWVAAGLRLADWQAVCPVTGRLDGVQWQTPQALAGTGDMARLAVSPAPAFAAALPAADLTDVVQ